MKLLAYNVSGNTVGIDIQKWNSNDLGNNNPFEIVYDDIILNGYDDITSIENWDEIGVNYVADYGAAKFAINSIFIEKSWTGLTNIEKDICIKYYVYPSEMDAAIHLMMTKGYSQGQAAEHLIKAWHVHHLNFIKSCRDRWNYAKYVVLLYLNRGDAENLFFSVRELIDYYVEIGILGTEYEQSVDGIMDYVYSTSGYVASGLEESGYVLKKGTWVEFKNELKKVFVYGEYLKYDE